MRHAMAGVVLGSLLGLAVVPASWAGNFFDVSDNGNVGIGTASAGALLDVARPATSSNSELIDIRANGFTQTITGGLTNARFNLFNQYTLSAAAAQTVTNGTTLHIAGPPTASGTGPATITAGSALRIAGGTVANTTNAYGLYVDAPTGATNNYAAVFPTGYVGVGTTSPGAPLDVNGSARVTSGGPAMILQKNGSYIGNFYLDFRNSSGQEIAYVGYGGSGSDAFYITNAITGADVAMSSSGGNVLLNQSGGNVGIGTASPAYLLDVASSAHASSFPTSSDIRLKKNVAQLTGVLPKLEKIKGVAFDWNSTYQAMGRATGHREVGLIAQEVEAVFPELVTTWGEQGYRAIDYGRLAGVLVEAIKEQQAEIRDLRKEIAALKHGQ